MKGLSLEACIDNFFSPETVKRTCTSCKYQTATEVVTFVRNPKTLIFQLKQFEYDPQLRRSFKKHGSIIIPYVIELPDSTKYKLSSIINHIGEEINFGHYTYLLVETSDETFTLVDDTQVTYAVRMTEVMAKTAYIMIYSKIDNN